MSINKKLENKMFNTLVYLFLILMVFMAIGPFFYVILTALHCSHLDIHVDMYDIVVYNYYVVRYYRRKTEVFL